MQEDHVDFLLFSGTSNPELAGKIAAYLGRPLGLAKIDRFPDGEISLRIEESVRDRDLFVIQTIALNPNGYLMELLVMIDALKRASARSITAVIPYFGYCRQDRRDQPRVPITAKLVADLLTKAGATGIVTMDLHTEQLQGFFDIPVDQIYARPQIAEALREQVSGDVVVTTPDIGSIKLARAYADHLKADFAIIDKQRWDATRVESTTLIGNVKGKDVLLADDMCSTGETLASAAKACQEEGARRIFAAVTHGLFVDSAIERLEKSPIETLWVSDTIPLRATSPKVKQVSVASLFGQAIRQMVASKLHICPSVAS